jgi:hypothetical protein
LKWNGTGWGCGEDNNGPSLPLSIANGGTGATTAAGARANLDTAFQDYMAVATSVDQSIPFNSSQQTVINFNATVMSSPNTSLYNFGTNAVLIQKTGLYLVQVSTQVYFSNTGCSNASEYHTYIDVDYAIIKDQQTFPACWANVGTNAVSQVEAYLYLQSGQVVSGAIMTNPGSILRQNYNSTNMFIARLSP